MSKPVVALVADHAGYELKNALRAVLGDDETTDYTARDPSPFAPSRAG